MQSKSIERRLRLCGLISCNLPATQVGYYDGVEMAACNRHATGAFNGVLSDFEANQAIYDEINELLNDDELVGD